MEKKYGQFDPHFIRQLPERGVERDFVSSVGDLTFLLNQNVTQVGEINFSLRRPFITGVFNSPQETQAHIESFSSDFESLLESEGLYEVVLALNALKDTAVRLKGRSMSWATSGFRRGEEPVFNDGYIVDSMIGFYYQAPESPAMYLKVAEERSGTIGIMHSLGYMWNIRIDPEK